MLNDQIVVRISEEEKAALKPLLDRRSMSQVVRQLIQDRIRQQKIQQARHAVPAKAGPAKEQEFLK
jgi:hypothetical protein